MKLNPDSPALFTIVLSILILAIVGLFIGVDFLKRKMPINNDIANSLSSGKANLQYKLDLSHDIKRIESFIIDGINSFVREHEAPKAIGIYSSPINGWISLNFNINKALEDVEFNCPDFEYVEYSMLEMPEWESMYGIDNLRIIHCNGTVINCDLILSNEEYNEPFFDLLLEIAKNVAPEDRSIRFFVQIVDSAFQKEI